MYSDRKNKKVRADGALESDQMKIQQEKIFKKAVSLNLPGAIVLHNEKL